MFYINAKCLRKEVWEKINPNKKKQEIIFFSSFLNRKNLTKSIENSLMFCTDFIMRIFTKMRPFQILCTLSSKFKKSNDCLKTAILQKVVYNTFS